MKPTPILIIKEKCVTANCYFCKGIGEQEIEIYALRDFEKIHQFVNTNGKLITEKQYKIHFKDYEIKKVSELKFKKFKNFITEGFLIHHNLKEDDKIVIKGRT